MATLEELKGFATVGNIYVDSTYTAEATPATDPITGEALEFGVNAFDSLPGGTASAVPANGSAMFITNVNLGGNRLYNGRPEKTTLYDVYVSKVTSGDIYVMPRAAGDYTPDTDTLNVYVEDVTIASGGYHGFGATTGANFAGNYDVTIKNSTMQYLAVATGSAYGVDNGDAANHRFAIINGDVNFTLSNLTVTSVAGVARGSIGSADEKGKVVGLIENSIFGNNFHIIFMGVDSAGNSFNSYADLDITISGSSFSGAFMMLPNQSSATREQNGELTFHGDIKLKVTGSTMNGLVVGTGRNGTGWQRVGDVDGNISFELVGSTTGVSFISKGRVGREGEGKSSTVVGAISANSVVGDFAGYELRSDKGEKVYADTTLTVTDSTMGNFAFLNSITSGGGTNTDGNLLYGAQTLELQGATTGNLLSSGGDHEGATYTMNFRASETLTQTGAITKWNTITVDAGASVQAESIANVSLVTLAQGAALSVGTFSGVDVLNVLGEYTDVNNTLVSGLESFSVGSDIKSVQLNGVELEYGFMPGQYSLVGDKLILHQGETVLVNSTFPGGGADVTYNEQVFKGYKTVAEAQSSFSADKYLITVVPVDGGTIDADIVTKNYGVIVQGTADSPIDMGGYDFIIGDLTTKYDGATIIITGLSSVGTIAFGDLDALFVSGTGVEAETVDLRGGAIGDADISFSGLTAKDVYLPAAKSIEGKLEIASGSIENIYNSPEGDGKLAVSLGKDAAVTNLYAEGKAISVGNATITNYYAGLKDGGEVATLDFTASGNVTDLVLGGVEKNTIGTVNAKFTGSGIQNVTVGGENDEITGNVNVELNGPVGVAPTSNFTGITFGATLAAIDGGSDKAAGKATLDVTGHSKVGKITGFDAINVTGGTLNVTGDGIEGTADIVNRRTISATGAIAAGSIDNTGVIAAASVTTTGALTNAGEFRVGDITVGGTFDNSNTIYTTGSITVDGVFTNSGDIYASSGDNAAITLNGDLVNTGTIYAGALSGVKSITTSSLFVIGATTIEGGLTVNADSRVGFQGGLDFNGVVKIDASSTLSVGGESFDGTSITIDVGDLIGYNEVVRANGGLDAASWTVNLSGANAGNYSLIRTATSIVVYSSDVVYVNSGFKADADNIVDGNKLLFGRNAFASVADAVKAAKAGAKIVIVGDKTGMDIDAANFDVVLDGSVVGDVTAKTLAVSSDSTVKSIASAGKLTVEAGAVLTVTETIPAALPIVIDASEGSGSRLVLDVDSTKVTLDPALVSILAPVGKEYTKQILAGESAHAGDLYLVSTDVVYFAPNKYEEILTQGDQIFEKDAEGNLILDEVTGEPIPVLDADGNPTYEVVHTGTYKALFVDGDFDKATGDALFNNVNIFQVKDSAVAVATGVSGVLVIVDHMSAQQFKVDGVITAFECDLDGVTANNSIYGGVTADQSYKGEGNLTVMVLGTTMRGNLYAIAKKATIKEADTYTLVIRNSTQLSNNTDHGTYFVGKNDGSTIDGKVFVTISDSAFNGQPTTTAGGVSTINGDINYDISGSTFAGGLRLVTNNLGAQINGEVNADITGTSISDFYVAYGNVGKDEENPSDLNVNISNSRIANLRAFRLSEDANAPTTINANLNLTILDTVITDAFYAVYTGDWSGDNSVRLRYTNYNSGSITVTLGGVSVANQIHGGDSLTHSRNALLNFNIPTVLHIVKGENNARTTANWVMEWETIIVDAGAEFYLNNDLQWLSGDVTTRIVNGAQPAMYKINLAGYEGGTKRVFRANSIYYQGDVTASTELIGDDATQPGRYEIVYVRDGNTLKEISVFDKADTIYLNSGYSGNTTYSGKALYYGFNAQSDATEAATIVNEWGSELVVTGGTFEDVDFASVVTVTGGAVLGTLSGAGSDGDVSITIDAKTSVDAIVAATSTVAGDLTVTVNGLGVVATDIDGVKDSVTGTAKLDVKADADLGDVTNFDEITIAKGAEVSFGELTNSGLVLTAENLIYADSVTIGDAVITIDVTGYEGGPRGLIVTADGITDYAASKVQIVGGTGFSVAYSDGTLSLLTTKPTDVYLNSSYSEATTGTLYDGVYLEFGFNAFNTFETAVAKLGEGYSVIMTGGEFTDDITLDGASLVMKGGVLGSIAGGTGASSLTVEGYAVVTDGIEDLTSFTITAGDSLVTDHIDMVDGGTITIKGGAFEAEFGNLHKVVDTVTGIGGIDINKIVVEGGVYAFYQNNDLFLLDKSHIYLDTTYTEAITGTTAANGDTLIYGVNAFNTDTAAYNALVVGGTLFVSNWGTPGSQGANIAPGKPASIVAQGPTNFSVIANGGTPQVVNDDITVIIDSANGTPQASSRLLGTGGGDNNRWVFNGNVVVTFKGSGNVNTNTDFGISSYAVFNGDLFQINIEGKSIDTDYWFIRNVQPNDFANLGKLELNITGVTTSNAAKWTGLFDGDPNLPTMHIVANITDSLYRAGNNDWSVGLVSTGDNGRNAIYDVHLNGSTIMGWISGARTSKWNGQPGGVYEGTRTLYVDGTKTSIVQEAMMFHHIIVDANAQLVVRAQAHFLAANSSGPNTVELDVSGYTGADKMLLSTPSFTGAEFELVLTGNTNDVYVAGLGKKHGAFIITKNGDVYYNTSFSDDDIGLAVGSSFVLIDGTTNTNAFTDYEGAKAAIDARTALGLDRTINVGGVGEGDAFYADGYKVNVYGGTYSGGVYGSAEDGSDVASVNMTISGGVFVDEVAVSDGEGKVTGDALIEITGGKFGTPVVYNDPDPENPDEDPGIKEEEVPVTINGSKDKVGGTSTLVLSKDLVADEKKDGVTVVNPDIIGDVVDFDAVKVGANVANFTISGDLTADAITVDASSQLTVLGDLTATTITIDATEYVGPSKVIAVSETFETVADQPAVTILGDLEVYDYKYVEDTLYLVSKHAGNVYLNSTWDESISGTIYNGELLVWGVNAVASMDDAVLKLTDDYTLFVTGGQYDGTYTFSGKAKIDIRDNATSIGGLVLGDGSSVTISGITAGGASSIGSIVAVEGYTSGLTLTANSKTAFGTINDVASFTFSAAAGVTADVINYRENGGALTANFDGYTAGAANILQTKDGINNFLKYNENIVIGGETVAVSRTVVGSQNNENKMMPYYDETKKAVIAAEAGEIALLDPNANDADNGKVITIEGKSTTMVYGYNLSNWNVNSGRYTISGGTLFADGGETGAFYWFFTAAPVNVNVTGITTGGFVAGYNNDSAADEKFRDGDFTAVINASTITWFAAIAGQGDENVHQEMVVGNLVPDDPEDPETGYHYEDTAWNITISNGTHDTNDFRVARYANLSGGTVNVTVSDYRLRGDLMLFDRIFNGTTDGVEDKQLKKVNVTLTNVQEPAAKWIQIWEPQESNSTNIVLTITDMNMAGDNTSTIGLFGTDLGGTWTGEADVYISGLTNTQGNLNGGRGQTAGGLDNIGGTRRLHVIGTENNIATIREFTSIELADGALLRANNISMSEGEGFILRGETGYKGDAKVFVVAGTTISGATEAKFLDAEDNEIEGYAAVVGNTNVFVYKTDGDVFYNNQYTAQTTGTFVTELDGTQNILVFGDNAVAGMDAAAQSIDFRGDATLRVVGAASTNFETRGYTAIFEGGRATTVWGGYNGSGEEEKAAVDSVDITVEKGATVSNINVAAEKAQVTGNAIVTIADGVAIGGTLNGAEEYVGGTSLLSFDGSATVNGNILGFDGVTVDADGLVVVGGAVSDVAITIDTTDFKNSSKVVMTAEGVFADTVTVTVGAGFDYKFSDDRKSLMVVSPFVGDAFFNTTWDASVTGLIVDGVELEWGKNAFNTMAAAVSAVGEGYDVIMDGGATTEDVNLNGHDFVAGGTQVGTITSAGAALTVKNTLAAAGLSGFASIDMASGTTLTVTGAVALAENATLSIDVTGYTMTADDEVVISAAGGITNLVTKNITVTGANNIAGYVSEEDGNVHLVKLSKNVYFSTAFNEDTQGVEDATTGEILFFGKNAFSSLDQALSAVVEGGTAFLYDVNGAVSPTGTVPKNLYLVGGTATALRILSGDRSAQQVNVPISLTVDGTTLAGDMEYILGRGNTWTSVGETLSYFQPVTVTMTGGTNTGNIRFVGQWSSILSDVTFNLTNWTIGGDIKPFAGDSRHGSNDTGLSKIVWNWENVTLPTSKWIAIANVTDWGADKVGADGVTRQSMDAIEFNMKNVNLRGSNSRIAAIVEGTGADRVDSNTDITFTVEDSSIDALLTTTLTDNYTLSTFGVKTLNITGSSSFIAWANYFQTLNIATADTFLSGGTVTFEGSGVINVDATGYTGGSKVLVSLTSGFRQSDDSKPVELNLVQDGEVYELVYGTKALVLKSNEIDNVYVNSTYSADITGATYATTGELLIFETNAFTNMADALTVLPADGSIFVTGGSVEVTTALPSNDLSIDVGANLTYKGVGAITITDTFVNEGTLTISTEGYEITGDKTVALTAGTISGAGTYKVIGDDRYLISREDNTLYFIERDVNVFVNTAWKDLDAGTIVTLISGETATVGINAFGTGDAALANVFGGGTITIEAGNVTFSSNVNCTVTALDGVTVDTLIVADKGSLVANSGATVINATVRKGGTLTVDAGALATGTLALGNGATATVNGTFNFDLTGLTTAADARVNNIGLISGTPSYSITVGAGQEDGVYTLAGGAADFTVTNAISVTTAAGDGTITALDQTVDIGGTLYTLSVTATGDLTLTKEVFVPAIEITYVDSNWTDKKDGDVVSVSGTTAIFGYDAFLTGDEAYAAVVDAGKVEVVGGTVSFTADIAKSVTINTNATLVGNATFTTAITVNGTIAFDTQYAADGAQFFGFNYISGDAKYTLVDPAKVGGWTLATDAAGFDSVVMLGDVALKVGDAAVTVGDFTYQLSLIGNDGSELSLTVANYVPPTPTTPTQAYANSEWTGKKAGDVVTVTGGTAVIGYDAFALLADAIAGVTDDGKVNVTGGEVSFADGYSKTITVDAGATVVGKATFDKAITVNGTFAFDTANATAEAAQFGGFSFVSGTATYTLTDAAAAKGTYLLASDAATFSADVTFGTYTLKVGEDVTVGDLVYTLAITDNSELALTIADKPVPPTPTEFVAKSDIDGNGVSDVMFVWTQTYDPTTGELVPGNYQHGYWMNGTSTWQSANATHPSNWDNLGNFDMTGDGKADSVLFGNVDAYEVPSAYIGYYKDGIDTDENWVTIGFLTNVAGIAWQNKVGNMTGNESGVNSIAWYAPELGSVGVWTDGTENWVQLNGAFMEGWTLAGMGDFDGDGKDSVVMSYNGGQFLYSVGIGDEAPTSLGNSNWSGWELRAIGDFSGDGKDDIILFHKEFGAMAMLVDGNSDNYQSIGQLDAKDWFVVGCGDYNGDKMDDLLVRQYSTGMLGYYVSADQSQWVELGRGVDMQWTVIA